MRLKKRANFELTLRDEQVFHKAFSLFLMIGRDRGLYAAEINALQRVLKTATEASSESELTRVLESLTSLIQTVSPEKVTLEEAADLYNIPVETLVAACEDGTLKSERTEGTKVLVSDLEEFHMLLTARGRRENKN